MVIDPTTGEILESRNGDFRSSEAYALARQMLAYNLAPIPILKETKVPPPGFGWKRFQRHGPTVDDLPKLFPEERDDLTVAVICGEPSDNLLVLDCDTPRSFELMIEALDHIPTWIVQTRRGFHIYLRTPVPVETKTEGDVDVRGQGSYVLAPGADYPGGGKYEFFPNSNSLPSIFVIDDLSELPFEVKEADLMKYSWIPRKTLGMLRGGGVKNYHSRSEHEAAIVLGLINHHFSYTEVLTTFRRRLYLGAKFSELNKADPEGAERWLKLTYDNAFEQSSRPSKTRLLIRQLRNEAESRIWCGRRANSEKQVFIACCRIAERAGSLRFAASVRDLAIEAGLTPTTVYRTLGRLEIYVRKVSRGTFANASEYELIRPEKQMTEISTLPHSEGVIGSVSKSVNHDLFSDPNLRHSGKDVWKCIEEASEPLTVAEIVRRTGRARSTVTKKLKVMSGDSYRMVEKSAQGWKALDVDLDEKAAELGLTGTRARKKRKLRQERRGRSASIAEYERTREEWRKNHRKT